MCGIAGYALAPGVAAPAAKLLQNALAHRGPDGKGQADLGQAALIHTRLAIIDLQHGDQPFSAGSQTLIANGEIYNYRELRAAMPDQRFATGSDCEPPLHLHRAQGQHFARDLRGMYAIAVYDKAEHKLTLSRDPFGIKPLYYTQGAGSVAFASEPQALLGAGLAPRAVRASARDELLQLQFTCGAATIFPGIFRVLPGETIGFYDGHAVERSRIAALPEGGPETISEDDALARLDRALTESVDLHQRSDVPYGMFLSGGIDSAALLAMMARLNTRPVLAYTAGFDLPGAADERAQAAAVATSVGAHHETIEITRDMVWRHLPRIVAAMDDPAADYAIIPSWFLARRARQDVKVVLCGEGGDELFAGYGRYRAATRHWFLGGKAMRGRGAFDELDVLRSRPTAWRDNLAAAELAAARPGRSRLQIAQATDITDWLPHDLLTKLDRCLMAHGVEGRTPFLDPGLAASSYRLPDALKIRDGRGKYLLRRWLATAMPAANPFAPKQGFTVPIGSWIAADGVRLGELVARQPGIAEIADPARVTGLFRHAHQKRLGMAAWLLLFYALWHRAHIQALPSDGPLLETLAAR